MSLPVSSSSVHRRVVLASHLPIFLLLSWLCHASAFSTVECISRQAIRTTTTSLNDHGMDAYEAQMRALSQQQQPLPPPIPSPSSSSSPPQPQELQPPTQLGQASNGEADNAIVSNGSKGDVIGSSEYVGFGSSSSSSGKTSAKYDSFIDEYFQLEELEDSESCTTEILLQSDGKILVGQTDGPLFASAKGWWEISEKFRMSIVRYYKTGQSGTDMGEFQYEVGRTFIGDITQIGNSMGISGSIQPVANADIDSDPSYEIGYFNMIDTTAARQQLGMGSGGGEGGPFMTQRSASSR